MMASFPPAPPPAWCRNDESFRVGDAIVDPTRNVVVLANAEEPLEPRIMDVLCFLAERPGEVLARGAIVDAVWGHSFGADESLTRAISRLRKVFSDSRSPASVIETISKRGYRLIAPVSVAPGRAPAASSAETAPTGPALKRRRRHFMAIAMAALCAAALAVLLVLKPGTGHPPAPAAAITVALPPFDFLGGDVAGRAKEIGEQVAGSLSRSSFIEVRRSNGAGPGDYQFAVHATVQRTPSGHMQVMVELRDAARDISIWSGRFDRSLAGSNQVGDDLAGAIAGEVGNRILSAAKAKIRKKPPMSLVPWELTLLATWVPGSDEVFIKPHAPDAFWPQQRALALDPDYAPAHAVLASAMAYRALLSSDADGAALRRLANSHADKARALAPYDAGVLYELATYYRLVGDRRRAVATLDRVLAIQPEHPVARFDRIFLASHCTTRGAAAAGQLESALSRLSADNPVRWVVLSHVADLDLAQGAFAKAATEADRSRQIVAMTWSGITLAAASAALGRDDEARRAAAETQREWPRLEWSWFAHAGVPIWCLGGPDQRRVAASFERLNAITASAPSR